MSQKPQVLPKIRFPEFRDEWKVRRLSELLSESKKRNFDAAYSRNDVLSVSGELGVVNQIVHLGRSYAGESILNYHVVESGDVVYTKSPLKANPYGIIKTNKGPAGIVSTLYAIYKVNSAACDGLFLDYYFSLDDHTNKYLRPLVRKGAKNDMKISNSYVLHDPIVVPGLLEQRKIAAYLGAIDEKIAQLARKKDLLVKYKRWLIQQLFSREIRFKADSRKHFPDWVETPIGAVLFERKSFATKGMELPHLSLTVDGVTHKSARYDRDFLVRNDEIKEYKITRVNDICYNPANLKFGVISRNKLCDGIFSPIYVTFEVRNADARFIEYLVIRKEFIERARRYEEGTVYERMAVKPADLLGLRVAIPCLAEQQKIAEFLTLIDKQLELATLQVLKAKVFRLAMLQQMFV
jgi:type I restriction enzyme, S subunit